MDILSNAYRERLAEFVESEAELSGEDVGSDMEEEEEGGGTNRISLCPILSSGTKSTRPTCEDLVLFCHAYT